MSTPLLHRPPVASARPIPHPPHPPARHHGHSPVRNGTTCSAGFSISADHGSSYSSLVRPSLGRRRATSALEAICRQVFSESIVPHAGVSIRLKLLTLAETAAPAVAYPLTPPTTPSELPRTPRRWTPSPGAPLRGRRLATLAITEGGRRRYIVDLETGAKFWAVEMPPARLSLLLEEAPLPVTPARCQRQQQTPPRTP